MSASVLAIARVGHSHRRSNWVQTKRPTLTPFGIWTRDWNCHVFFVPKTMTFCWEAYSLKIVSFRYLWRVQVCSNTSIRIVIFDKLVSYCVHRRCVWHGHDCISKHADHDPDVSATRNPFPVHGPGRLILGHSCYLRRVSLLYSYLI
jgi:hypothetical protein